MTTLDQQTNTAVGAITMPQRVTPNPTEIARRFPLRIASIYVPILSDSGHPTDVANEWVETQLLNTFGGYTRHWGAGAWKDPTTGGTIYRDPVYRYDVAMEDHGLHYVWLEDLAREVGALAHQKAVAIIYPNGVFRVVPTCDEG